MCRSTQRHGDTQKCTYTHSKLVNIVLKIMFFSKITFTKIQDEVQTYYSFLNI